jgi:hypothetical protein
VRLDFSEEDAPLDALPGGEHQPPGRRPPAPPGLGDEPSKPNPWEALIVRGKDRGYATRLEVFAAVVAMHRDSLSAKFTREPSLLRPGRVTRLRLIGRIGPIQLPPPAQLRPVFGALESMGIAIRTSDPRPVVGDR